MLNIQTGALSYQGIQYNPLASVLIGGMVYITFSIQVEAFNASTIANAYYPDNFWPMTAQPSSPFVYAYSSSQKVVLVSNYHLIVYDMGAQKVLSHCPGHALQYASLVRESTNTYYYYATNPLTSGYQLAALDMVTCNLVYTGADTYATAQWLVNDTYIVGVAYSDNYAKVSKVRLDNLAAPR